MAWIQKEAKCGLNIDSASFVSLFSYSLDWHHWRGHTTQRQSVSRIHTFWDLNFWCDYQSLKGLFYNRVTYQICWIKCSWYSQRVVLNGKKKKKKKTWTHWDLILYSSTLCLCCLLYLIATSQGTLWNELLWGIASFNVSSWVLWTTVVINPRTDSSTAFFLSKALASIARSHLHTIVNGTPHQKPFIKRL